MAYMKKADGIIKSCIQANLTALENLRTRIIAKVQKEIETETDVEKVKKALIDYRIDTETDLLNKLISRIKDFRL